MNNIEEKMSPMKRKLDKIEVPETLDTRLEAALEKVPKRKKPVKRFIQYVAVTAALVLLSLMVYNHQVLAYYSKKIIGFEHFYGPFGTLNEEEKGQVIEETIELEDGLYFTVNGIMTDANQLVLFYTFSAPDGLDKYDTASYHLGGITGFQTEVKASGGTSKLDETETEQKGIFHYDAVNPMAKKLTLHIWDWNGDLDDVREITFAHDPNKAMKANLDVPIDDTLELDKGELTVKSITASPTMTRVEGTIDGLGVVDKLSGLDGIKLMANGDTVGRGRQGVETEDEHSTFTIDFRALPEDLESLSVLVKDFHGYRTLDDAISLEAKKEPIEFHGEKVEIREVGVEAGQLKVTIASDASVALEDLSVKKGKKNVAGTFEDEAYGTTVKKMDRTYTFPTDEIPNELMVEGMYYLKNYDHDIEIPIK